MLCVKCRSLFDEPTAEFAPRADWSGLHEPLRTILCARCGTVLPVRDPAEAMLSKLSQLSKFGIGADDRPILTSPEVKE